MDWIVIFLLRYWHNSYVIWASRCLKSSGCPTYCQDYEQRKHQYSGKLNCYMPSEGPVIRKVYFYIIKSSLTFCVFIHLQQLYGITMANYWTIYQVRKQRLVVRTLLVGCIIDHSPHSKVHGANMGPIWVRQVPGGPMLAPWTLLSVMLSKM